MVWLRRNTLKHPSAIFEHHWECGLFIFDWCLFELVTLSWCLFDPVSLDLVSPFKITTIVWVGPLSILGI
jgi:hypothetical protein